MNRSLLSGMAVAMLTWTAVAADKIGPLTADEFVAKVDALNRAYGRRPSAERAELTDAKRRELLERAQKICDGYVFFNYREPIQVGSKGIDWTGKQRNHQEWVAQLNRFFMLDELCRAYRQTGDEKYPQRARELMEDWFDYYQQKNFEFLDPQWNNQLNASIRLRNWIFALSTFAKTRAFDDAFARRTLAMIERQTNHLARMTQAGTSNWQIAQAQAMLDAGIVGDFLPDAKAWREKGAAVLNSCFKQQFRPDGSHVENTTGYHHWMTTVMIDMAAVGKLHPELHLANDPAAIEKALQFSQLSRSFAFNDSGYNLNRFPKMFRPDLTELAIRAGIPDFKPLEYGVFPDAGLVFGGNRQDRFFFDAGPYCHWHTHLSRLSFEYIAGGYALIVDPAITTYEYQDPHFACGRETSRHATVNFNDANQLHRDAKLLDARLSDQFGIVVGEYNAGFYEGPLVGKEVQFLSGSYKDKLVKNLDAAVQRAILWLPDQFLLVFDRTKIARAPHESTVTNYVFPVAPMEKYHLNPRTLTWYSENAKRPNVLIRMLQKPADQVALTCVEGQKEPRLEGWIGTYRDDMIPAPTVRFAAETGNKTAYAVTLITAFPAGQSAPEITVTASEIGKIDFTLPGGDVNQLRYHGDWTATGELAAGNIRAVAGLMLVQKNRIFVYRASALTRDGKNLSLPEPDYTGWIE